jgi:3-oxoadipate enol-lactonase
VTWPGGGPGGHPGLWITAAGDVGDEPVVLLHGLGSCGQDWVFQASALAGRYRVLAPDLPGHGRSPLPKPWLSVEEMAGQVREVMVAEHLPPAHLVGLSLGAAVALRLAIVAAERLRTLTLVNGFSHLGIDGRLGLRGLRRLALVLSGDMHRLGRSIATDLFPRPDQAELRTAAAAQLASNSRRAYLNGLLATARFDVRSQLSVIRAPTLIIAGACDRTLSTGYARDLARRIPGGRALILPGSGHATLLDSPQRFNQVLLEFLRTQ